MQAQASGTASSLGQALPSMRCDMAFMQQFPLTLILILTRKLESTEASLYTAGSLLQC